MAASKQQSVQFWVDDGTRLQHSKTYLISRSVDTVDAFDIPELLEFLGELALSPTLDLLRWGFTVEGKE